MKTILQDDRTTDETKTHDNIVIALDTCLSGWGDAEGMSSYAGWACSDKHVEAVESWVENRSDMSNVEIITDIDDFKPRSKKHVHIYVVGEGHPSLCQKTEV